MQTGTLSNGTTYAITARVTDAAGNQSVVSSNTFTVTEDTTAPTVPTVVHQISQTGSGANKIETIGWTAGTDTGGSGIANYSYSLILDSNGSTVTSGTTTSTSVAIGSLGNNKNYTIPCQSVDWAGNVSSDATSAIYRARGRGGFCNKSGP